VRILWVIDAGLTVSVIAGQWIY